MHKEPGQWRRDHDGDQHQAQEVPGQQRHDARYIRPEYFSHADLPGSLPCGENGQPQQSQTGNKDREERKIIGQFADQLLALVELVVFRI